MTFFHQKKPLPLWSLTTMIGFSVGAALFRMQNDVGNFDFMTPFRATAIPSQMNATIQAPNETGGLFMVAAWFLFPSHPRIALGENTKRLDTSLFGRPARYALKTTPTQSVAIQTSLLYYSPTFPSTTFSTSSPCVFVSPFSSFQTNFPFLE